MKHRIGRQLDRWRSWASPRSVFIDQLLMGGEGGIPAAKYARLVGDPLRPSQPISGSPHVQLLQRYQAVGDCLFDRGTFERTAYYKNALQCLDITGSYFDATTEEQIVTVARRFVDRFLGANGRYVPVNGQSRPGEPILVGPIRYSDKYEVIDGQHRLAIAHLRGERRVTVLPERMTVLTPLQSILLDVLCVNGEPKLCQPVEAPEIGEEWKRARPCSEQLAKMRGFLGECDLLRTKNKTYLDLGSSYGWFVAEMRNLGFDAHGVERDPSAASLGPLLYGIKPEQIYRTDCVRFLREHDHAFDVTSCFGLLHQFAMRRGSVTAEEFIRLIDRRTTKVLFLESGQNPQTRCRQHLPEWDTDFIETWLKKHTTFTSIHRLVLDEDSQAPLEHRCSSTLLACQK
jgi:hypothetical protein